jgi:hypothetical protein
MDVSSQLVSIASVRIEDGEIKYVMNVVMSDVMVFLAESM